MASAGFEFFDYTGIEVMAMIKKGQMKTRAGNKQSPADMFFGLAEYGDMRTTFFVSD